jgi:hypothetical protein
LAAACHRSGERAVVFARRGFELQPDYCDLLDTRGVILYRFGRLREAGVDLSRCVELLPADAPGLAGSYLHLARVWDRLGEPRHVAENLNLALASRRQSAGLTPGQVQEATDMRNQLTEGVQP